MRNAYLLISILWFFAGLVWLALIAFGTIDALGYALVAAMDWGLSGMYLGMWMATNP